MHKKATFNFREKLPSDKALVKVLSDFYQIKANNVYQFDAKNRALVDRETNISFPINGYNLFWEYFYPSETDTMPTYDELLQENQRLRFELEQFKDIKPKNITL